MPKSRLYPMSQFKLEKTKEYLEENLQKGVRGWVYNSFGCTVVEWGVVARVTMITIDK